MTVLLNGLNASTYCLEVLVSQKKSRVHRLVEPAEFYQVGGYQDWSRMQQTDTLADSDSATPVMDHLLSCSSLPEIAHQALAATLGLVYYKIRNEVGEGPNAVLFRQQENVASASPGWPKPTSVLLTLSCNVLLINGPSVAESQPSVSEDFDKLGWKPFSDVSEDAMSKLRSIDPRRHWDRPSCFGTRSSQTKAE
ncbi:hypothetical protein N7523_005523 [Penicillium sp. IBT 18751x]|nr:hypothetical protein N7523_005523 [Penicillium sp. IBT 18751x]